MSFSCSSSFSGTQTSVANEEMHGQRFRPSHQIQSSPRISFQENLTKQSSALDGESCLLTRLHNNSPTSSSFRLLREAMSEKTKHPTSSLHRNLSGSRYLSKLGPKRLFRRQSSDSRTCLRTVKSLETGEASGIGHRANQVMTISQIVEASKREDSVWSDVNGSSQFSWNTDIDGLDDEHMTLPIERIRICNFQTTFNDTWDNDNIIQKCDLCSRCLTHRSPWSYDLPPTVAVLVCGHVFHGDCLERSTLDVSKRDPPCPLCARTENVASKAFLLKLDGGVRGTMESLRNKLAKTFNRKSVASSNTVAKASRMKWPTVSSSISGKDSSKPLSKLRPETMKDFGPPYPGPARVSPDQT